MNTPPLIVKSIRLSLEDWGVNKGRLTGCVEFVNEYGELKVNVDAERAGRIVAVLADALVDTARATANVMRESIVAQAASNAALIEAPKESA